MPVDVKCGAPETEPCVRQLTHTTVVPPSKHVRTLSPLIHARYCPVLGTTISPRHHVSKGAATDAAV